MECPAIGIYVICSWIHLSNSVWEPKLVQDFKSYLGSYLLPTVVLKCVVPCSQKNALCLIILPRPVVYAESVVLAGNPDIE